MRSGGANNCVHSALSILLNSERFALIFSKEAPKYKYMFLQDHHLAIGELWWDHEELNHCERCLEKLNDFLLTEAASEIPPDTNRHCEIRFDARTGGSRSIDGRSISSRKLNIIWLLLFVIWSISWNPIHIHIHNLLYVYETWMRQEWRLTISHSSDPLFNAAKSRTRSSISHRLFRKWLKNLLRHPETNIDNSWNSIFSIVARGYCRKGIIQWNLSQRTEWTNIKFQSQCRWCFSMLSMQRVAIIENTRSSAKDVSHDGL
jgi:hypothetical protein